MSKHTLAERVTVVLSVIERQISVNTVAKEYKVSNLTIKEWIRKYQAEGVDGLKETKTWKRYSSELKIRAVNFYVAGKGSLTETCKVFNISSTSVLRRWINLYTSGQDIKSTSKGRNPMKPGRKTTIQERIEIAQYTIANEYNYQEAAEKYQVSYQQVYSWVRKYKKDGEESLHDRRGKPLESKPNLTDEEKLQLRIKELEHRNQYLEAENGLLKKLKEIERGMGLRD